jgi:hypothetical protein
MPAARLPPSRLARLALVAAIAFVAVAPRLARADDAQPWSCSTVAQAEQMAIAFGAQGLTTLTEGQRTLVSAVFERAVASLPPGDKVAMALRKDGSAIFYFVDGDRACAPVKLAKEIVDAIMAADRGDAVNGDNPR